MLDVFDSLMATAKAETTRHLCQQTLGEKLSRLNPDTTARHETFAFVPPFQLMKAQTPAFEPSFERLPRMNHGFVERTELALRAAQFNVLAVARSDENGESPLLL